MSHREKQAQVETGTGNGKAIQTLSPPCTPLHIALFSLGRLAWFCSQSVWQDNGTLSPEFTCYQVSHMKR